MITPILVLTCANINTFSRPEWAAIVVKLECFKTCLRSTLSQEHLEPLMITSKGKQSLCNINPNDIMVATKSIVFTKAIIF